MRSPRRAPVGTNPPRRPPRRQQGTCVSSRVRAPRASAPGRAAAPREGRQGGWPGGVGGMLALTELQGRELTSKGPAVGGSPAWGPDRCQVAVSHPKPGRVGGRASAPRRYIRCLLLIGRRGRGIIHILSGRRICERLTGHPPLFPALSRRFLRTHAAPQPLVFTPSPRLSLAVLSTALLLSRGHAGLELGIVAKDQRRAGGRCVLLDCDGELGPSIPATAAPGAPAAPH